MILAQAAEASSGWGPLEWIALVAAIAAVVSAGVTGLSIWLTYKGTGRRLEHERVMQQAQFEEDRRSAGLDSASKAYRMASDLGPAFAPSEIDHLAAHGDLGLKDDDQWASAATATALEAVSATGWTAEVREAAKQLRFAVVTLSTIATITIGQLQEEPPDEDAAERYDTAFAGYMRALEEFRATIAGDDHSGGWVTVWSQD